jgi:hypothetical protein
MKTERLIVSSCSPYPHEFFIIHINLLLENSTILVEGNIETLIRWLFFFLQYLGSNPGPVLC